MNLDDQRRRLLTIGLLLFGLAVLCILSRQGALWLCAAALLPTSLVILAIVIPDEVEHRKISRRRRNNQCLHCGYDLRQSPDRCPECNTPRDHVRPAD